MSDTRDYRTGPWGRMEMAIPLTPSRLLPRVFVVSNSDYETLPPLPKDDTGMYRYKGIPVIPEREIFLVPPDVFATRGLL